MGHAGNRGNRTTGNVSITVISRWRGGATGRGVERWICDQQVVGSNPTWGKAA